MKSPLDDIPARLVRRVAQENTPASQALFSIAACGRREWTITDWAAVLKELDESDETVSQYRALREV